uniref:sulfite oxidase n=1 Tax=Macrostomum lignano TaxID=282301 RepID=A0A1I8FXP4_9PLAT
LNKLQEVKLTESATNRSLAEHNLSQQSRIEQGRRALISAHKEAADLGRHHRELTSRLSGGQQGESLETLHSLLQSACLEAEEKSDSILDQFQSKRMSLPEFINKYTEARALYHTRRAKTDKVTEISNQRIVQASSAYRTTNMPPAMPPVGPFGPPPVPPQHAAMPPYYYPPNYYGAPLKFEFLIPLRVLSSSATKENQAQVIRCHSDKKREDKSRSNGGTFAAVTASVAMATVANTVYDVTNFVDSHPGGEKILLAAGKDVEPFWDLYAVHKSPHVLSILAEYAIARLTAADALELQRRKASEQSDDGGKFANEPKRSPLLVPINKRPYNAMSPPEILMDHYYTPNAIHFVRNHLPVPKLPEDANSHRVKLDLKDPTNEEKVNRSLNVTVEQLRNDFPRVSYDVTLACAGNRRNEMAQWRQARGLEWRQTAVSNARWTGAPLHLVLKKLFGLDLDKARKLGYRHVQFEGMDGDSITGDFYGASVPVEVALDESRGLLLAYEMNGEAIPADHGYPLRVIVPGAIGARSVKWLCRIALSRQESSSFWLRSDYKTFQPSLYTPTVEDFVRAPAQLYWPVVSAICWPPDGHVIRDGYGADEDEVVQIRGYAFSGAGAGVVRVEVTTDDGNTWQLAQWCNLDDAPDDVDDSLHQPFGQRWAWRLWEATVPAPKPGQSVTIACKAVDDNGNQQPERWSSVWNARGLLGNAWHRVT